jgi:hypothetical protein
MPYFVYKITSFPIRQLELLQTFDSFKDASVRAKVLRTEMPADANVSIKVMFAETPLHAEDMLSQVREPEPRTGEDY